MPFELGGNSPDTINSVACLCMLGLFLAIVLGCLLDRCFEQVGSASKRPPGAAILLLIASYVLLLPGLYCCLFSFNIMLNFGFIKMGIGPDGGLDKAPAMTESMMGLLAVLKKSGAWTAAHAITFYAMIIPSVKLALLILGQVLRGCPSIANVCTTTVQVISKWACPDMFAYIMLLHLVRGMNHPRMLLSEMQLDLGFTCFSLFCIGSTLASLGIHAGEAEDSRSVFPCSWLKRELVLFAVIPLFLGFLWSFHCGLSAPVMELRIHLEALFQPTGPLPTTFMGVPTRPVIEQLKIPEKANAEVSVWSAIVTLQESSSGGEVNSTIALVMIAVFVVAFTAADMVLLLVIAVFLRLGLQTAGLIAASVALKKLSMLDVLIMGVIVVSQCMSMYQKDGIFVTSQNGLYMLTCAEMLHYLAFFLVTCAPERLKPDPEYSNIAEGSQEMTAPLQDDVPYLPPIRKPLSPSGLSREADLMQDGDGL